MSKYSSVEDFFQSIDNNIDYLKSHDDLFSTFFAKYYYGKASLSLDRTCSRFGSFRDFIENFDNAYKCMISHVLNGFIKEKKLAKQLYQEKNEAFLTWLVQGNNSFEYITRSSLDTKDFYYIYDGNKFVQTTKEQASQKTTAVKLSIEPSTCKIAIKLDDRKIKITCDKANSIKSNMLAIETKENDENNFTLEEIPYDKDALRLKILKETVNNKQKQESSVLEVFRDDYHSKRISSFTIENYEK